MATIETLETGSVEVGIDWWQEGVGAIRLTLDPEDNRPLYQTWMTAAEARDLAQYIIEIANDLDARSKKETTDVP